jgi:cellulose synthase/poly-beta-1,6-N-acetylglucosamine synthase-like glycosyltransferase
VCAEKPLSKVCVSVIHFDKAYSNPWYRISSFFMLMTPLMQFLAFAYHQGKDIVFGFIIEYSSLRDFGP